MLTLVLGGAASGKSEYAEALVLRSALPRYYLATMQVWDAECAARVEKHRKMRAAKQFETLECPLHLETVHLPRRGTALLEDLGNLTANELYDPAGAGDAAAEHILQGLESLAAQCENLIVVSNEVFSGGADYAGDTDRYLLALARVNNALASYGDREKKLEILKDPHCGAFAVIRLCSYFAAYLCLAACVQFTPRVGALWTLALVLERALSGLAVAAFPMAKNTGLAHTFASTADRTAVRNVLAVLAILLCGALLALGGGALAAVAILLFLWYHHVAVQQLGGITGDLAGWFLQKTELWMLAALCACQWGGLL